MNTESWSNKITPADTESTSGTLTWVFEAPEKKNLEFEKDPKIFIVNNPEDGSILLHLETFYKPDANHQNNRFYIKLSKDNKISKEDLKKEIEYSDFEKVVQKYIKQSEFYLILASESKSVFNSKNIRSLQKFFLNELELITNNPAGEKSIDPFKDKSWAEERRTVNRIEEDFRDFINKNQNATDKNISFAIKGYGTNESPSIREDLVDQYLNMQYLQKALPKIHLIWLNVCNMFAVCGTKNNSWLLMEDLTVYGAKQLVEAEKTKLVLGGGPNTKHLVIEKKDYPQFFENVSDFTYVSANSSYIDLADLTREIHTVGSHKNLNFNGLDLAGRNIMEANIDGDMYYFLIDQREKPHI